MHAPAAEVPPKGAVRTSDILETLFTGPPDSRVSLDDIRAALADRAFGFIILVLTLPNCVPVPGPPGLSAVLGVPVALLALQLAAGMRQPWLPGWLGQRSVRRGNCTRILDKALPLLRRLERLVKPRLAALNTPAADRINGALLLLFAIVLSLPIPTGNLLPALAVALLALGMIEQDGVATLAGIGLGVVGTLWASFIVVAGAAAAERLWAYLF